MRLAKLLRFYLSSIREAFVSSRQTYRNILFAAVLAGSAIAIIAPCWALARRAMTHWQTVSQVGGAITFVGLLGYRVADVIYRRFENAERVIGEDGTVKREGVMMCAQIKEFVDDYVKAKGPIPLAGLTPNPTRTIKMQTAQTKWSLDFAKAFQDEIAAPAGRIVNKLESGKQYDFKISNLLQTANCPNDALNLAALIFKLTLNLDTVHEEIVNDPQP